MIVLKTINKNKESTKNKQNKENKHSPNSEIPKAETFAEFGDRRSQKLKYQQNKKAVLLRFVLCCVALCHNSDNNDDVYQTEA